jgi:hypothetical protein
VSLKLQIKGFKIAAVLDAAAVASLHLPRDQARVTLSVTDANGHKLQSELASKSLRRCITAIAEAGPDGVTIILQGKLNGTTIEDCGISAQPRTPKKAAA